jgi:nucleoside 2-deoxyribosyltransferase
MFVYLAGPDVFRPDAIEWAINARALCHQHGYEALIPLDSGETLPKKIFDANVAMIRRAQIVIANLDSFRGAEPDSGTVFEVGYAAALGKKICGYVSTPQTVLQRVELAQGKPIVKKPPCDLQGWAIEDFDLPANLMLAMAMPIIAGGLEAALRQLRQRTAAPAPAHA